MKIVTIVGARPQFIKAASISRELRRRHEEFLVHTGQHYDYDMSGAFFDELEIPPPDVNLGVGSGTHAVQTAAMVLGIEQVLEATRPDWLLIYGDTNSTLAGALAAAKVNIPVAHVEAGLRSFNRQMPEEINRLVADRLSRLLFCSSETAVKNLEVEGISTNVHLVGDVMLDTLRWALKQENAQGARILPLLGLKERAYLLATVHRSQNTDEPARLSGILNALDRLDEPVVFPVHPRTRKAIAALGHCSQSHVRMIDPLSYVAMSALVASARIVLTDSGGLQKEAYWLGVPCVTLRDETEWVETVAAGWNVLTGCDADRIVRAVKSFRPATCRPSLYGDGSAAVACIDLLEGALPNGAPARNAERCRSDDEQDRCKTTSMQFT